MHCTRVLWLVSTQSPTHPLVLPVGLVADPAHLHLKGLAVLVMHSVDDLCGLHHALPAGHLRQLQLLYFIAGCLPAFPHRRPKVAVRRTGGLHHVQLGSGLVVGCQQQRGAVGPATCKAALVQPGMAAEE